MSRGYSISVAETIKQANGELLGVRLGVLCIQKGIPVSQVASATGVTRQTVYHWFCGARSPQGRAKSAVEAYLKTLGH